MFECNKNNYTTFMIIFDKLFVLFYKNKFNMCLHRESFRQLVRKVGQGVETL